MWFSLKFTYTSNKMRYIFFLILRLLSETCPLLSIYFLKNILDEVVRITSAGAIVFMDRVIYRRDDIAASHRLHTEIFGNSNKNQDHSSV